jgi:hypothetical protein
MRSTVRGKLNVRTRALEHNRALSVTAEDDGTVSIVAAGECYSAANALVKCLLLHICLNFAQ